MNHGIISWNDGVASVAVLTSNHRAKGISRTAARVAALARHKTEPLTPEEVESVFPGFARALVAMVISGDSAGIHNVANNVTEKENNDKMILHVAQSIEDAANHHGRMPTIREAYAMLKKAHAESLRNGTGGFLSHTLANGRDNGDKMIARRDTVTRLYENNGWPDMEW